MAHERRQLERFDIILVVVFRPLNEKVKALKKSLDYFLGITRNFSREGLSFEYHHCDLQPGEILDIKLKHPHRELSISALGEIVWEKRSDVTCEAGIKFWGINREAQSALTDLRTLDRELPWESFYYNKDVENPTIDRTGERSVLRERTSQKEELILDGLNKINEMMSELESSVHNVSDTTGIDESVESSNINSAGTYGLNVVNSQNTFFPVDEDQAASAIPERIKGRRKKKHLFPSIVKALITTIIGIVIITFRDINIRLPQEEMTDTKELKYETREDLIVADKFEKRPEADEETVLVKEHKKNDKLNQLIEKIRAGDPYASQRTYNIQEESFFHIGRFVIAGSIANIEPVDIKNVFTASTEKVYCFLEARDITEDRAVNLVWYHSDIQVAQVELPLKKGLRWRTYSSKRLMGLGGTWKVELQEVNGTVLEAITFIVE